MAGASNHKIRRDRIHFTDPVCVECGGMGKLTSGRDAYPHKPEKHRQAFFRCECGALVGCHPGTAVAAGRPASAQTRALRWQAHELFDARWGRDVRTRLATGHARAKAYKWLARELGLPARECHIGFFNADQCRVVIALCSGQKEAA